MPMVLDCKKNWLTHMAVHNCADKHFTFRKLHKCRSNDYNDSAADLEIGLELLLHGFHASVLHVLQAVHNLQVAPQSCPVLLLCILQIPVQGLNARKKPLDMTAVTCV